MDLYVLELLMAGVHARAALNGVEVVADETAASKTLGLRLNPYIVDGENRLAVALRLQRATDDPVGGDVGMTAAGQRHGAVQKSLGPGNHARATHRVVAAGARGVTHRIGAIEGIVEAAPAGIGGIEGIARVQNWHHQLRSGKFG